MKKLLAIVLGMMLLFSLASCGKETEVILPGDAVMMDMQTIDQVGGEHILILLVSYLYSGKSLPEFDILEIQGTNVDILSWVCEDASSDTYKKTKKDGYRYGEEYVTLTFDFADLEEGEEEFLVQIDAIVLTINGKEQTLVFDSPLTYITCDMDLETMNTGWLQPCLFASEATMDGWVCFAYQAESDMTLEGFSLGSYISVDNFAISIMDGETEIEVMTGDMSSFPIEVKQGQIISIEGVFASEDVPSYSGYQNIYTSAVLTYVYNDMVCEQRYSFIFAGYPLGTGLTTVIEEMLAAQ